jgi:hypothetical protein
MAAASERGVTPDRLLETLVRTVLEDRLVDAVLDDRPAEEAVAVECCPAQGNTPE